MLGLGAPTWLWLEVADWLPKMVEFFVGRRGKPSWQSSLARLAPAAASTAPVMATVVAQEPGAVDRLAELQSAAAVAAATSHGSVNGSVTMDGGALTSADIIPAPDAQEPEREPKPDEEVVEATVAAIIDPPASMPEAQGVAAVASNPEEEYEESYTQLLGGFAELLSRALARGCAWALPVTSQLLDHTREGLYHCEEWVRKP
eukprot:SAG25_NODE_171_length_13027_cov_80.469833_2_plen_203_part_00